MSVSSNAAKITKCIPASENGPGVRCTTKGGAYIVTQCVEKQRFTLWKETEGGYDKLGTAKSPLDLYDKIPW